MEIVVLGFNGCLGAGFVGSVDMLKLSSLMISKNGRHEPFSVSTASFDGRPFKDSSGSCPRWWCNRLEQDRPRSALDIAP